MRSCSQTSRRGSAGGAKLLVSVPIPLVCLLFLSAGFEVVRVHCAQLLVKAGGPCEASPFDKSMQVHVGKLVLPPMAKLLENAQKIRKETGDKKQKKEERRASRRGKSASGPEEHSSSQTKQAASSQEEPSSSDTPQCTEKAKLRENIVKAFEGDLKDQKVREKQHKALGFFVRMLIDAQTRDNPWQCTKPRVMKKSERNLCDASDDGKRLKEYVQKAELCGQHKAAVCVELLKASQKVGE